MENKAPVYCNVSFVCKNTYKCDRVLTREIIEASNSTDEEIQVEDSLPDCFIALWDDKE